MDILNPKGKLKKLKFFQEAGERAARALMQATQNRKSECRLPHTALNCKH
jgi:hypothetical protein